MCVMKTTKISKEKHLGKQGMKMCLLREKSNFILKKRLKRVKREKGKTQDKSEGKKVVKSLWKKP